MKNLLVYICLFSSILCVLFMFAIEIQASNLDVLQMRNVDYIPIDKDIVPLLETEQIPMLDLMSIVSADEYSLIHVGGTDVGTLFLFTNKKETFVIGAEINSTKDSVNYVGIVFFYIGDFLLYLEWLRHSRCGNLLEQNGYTTLYGCLDSNVKIFTSCNIEKKNYSVVWMK